MEITIAIAATASVIAFLLGLAIRGKIGASKLAKAEELAAKIIKEAEKEARSKRRRPSWRPKMSGIKPRPM